MSRITPIAVSMLICLTIQNAGCKPIDNDALIFPDDSKSYQDSENIITPPVLPVIEHLENDPTTLRREDIEKINARKNNNSVKGSDSRFGFSDNFGVVPTEDGGYKAKIEHSFEGLGGIQHHRGHTVIVGPPTKGFQVSHSSSQSSSFGGDVSPLGASLSGSQASSHASSFSAGFQGVSGSSSTASSSSSGGNLFGPGFSTSSAQSQSSSSPPSLQAILSAFSQGNNYANSFQNNLNNNLNSVFPASNNPGFFIPQINNNFDSDNVGVLSFGSQLSYAPEHGFASPLSSERSRSFVFPGPSVNRYRDPQYRPHKLQVNNVKSARWQQYNVPDSRPGGYQVIRIEV